MRVIASPDGKVALPERVNSVRTTLEELANAVDGVVFSADGKTLLACLEAKREYVVPDGVETVGPKAFCGCDTLKSIEFSKSVKTIGAAAFSGAVRYAPSFFRTA